MVKRKWIVPFLISLFVVVVVPLRVAASEIRLTVSVPHSDADGGVAASHLRLGMLASATNEFDPSFDVEAFPSPGLTAVVRHSEYSAAHQLLWWDYRADAFPQTWEVEVSSDRPNANITFSGAPPPTVPSGCSRGRWTIRDTQTNQTLELGGSMLTYSYPNMVGVTRRFVVVAAEVSATSPPTPQNFWSPRQGRTSVYLAWSGSDDPAVRYHVHRETGQGTVRLTATPIATASYVDIGVDRAAPVSYRVTAVADNGCESEYSSALTLEPHR